jgi:hypothetical protein
MKAPLSERRQIPDLRQVIVGLYKNLPPDHKNMIHYNLKFKTCRSADMVAVESYKNAGEAIKSILQSWKLKRGG